MKIKELSEKSGVSVRTIRYYTEIGLLPDVEKDGKYKDYPESMIETLKRIKELQSKFLPLEKIKEVLNDENFNVEEENLTENKRIETITTAPAMIYTLSNDFVIIAQNGKRLSQEKLNKIKDIL